jgi:hypothetical protein
MASNEVNLPPGFTLDESSLPEGFVLDKPITPKKKTYISASDDPSQVGIFNALESIDKGIYEGGGYVTDLMMKTGVSPETAAKVGYGANVSLQALSAGMGGPVGSMAKTGFESLGRKSMQSALKPTLDQLKSGDAAIAIDTLLNRGWNATEGGVRKIKDAISVLDDKVKAAIANSSETVNKGEVGLRLSDIWDKFKNQVNPQADLEAIKKAWMNFRNHPALAGKQEIPVQLAQDLKQGTYRQIGKKYGELSSADIEAQKALARGLRETIGDKVPGVTGMLEEEAALIKTLNVTERRSLMELNKNPMGLSLLTHSPKLAAAYMADKSAAFKSLVGRMLYSGAEAIPSSAGRAAGGATMALSEMNRQNEMSPWNGR